jgi:hypothetical protein
MLKTHRRIAVRAGTVATIAVAALAYAQTPEQEAAEPVGGLTAEELEAEAPVFLSEEPIDLPDPPVAAADATDVKIAPVPDIGYFDEQGRYVIDLMEQDYTYLAIRAETADGRPVEGAEPVFSIEGTSQLLEPKDVSMLTTTNQYGVIEFAVVGGQMGLDRISIEYGEASTEILVNVISLRATLYSLPDGGEGYLPWDDLLQAQVSYDDMMLNAKFPEAVTERSGETVKLSGFMMPLETGVKQHWFLLTSHPPSCYFHVPGGPAGAVEVFAEEGIEVSWDPIVLEGRFEALEKSDSAVYRLSDARIVGQ